MGYLGRWIIAAIVISAVACYTKENLAPKVTAANIRRIEMGMSRAQVEEILGPPLSVDSKDERFVGGETLAYSQQAGRLRKYSMLWVHLKDDQVVEVYAKRKNLITEEMLYQRNLSHRGGAGLEMDRFAQSFP